MALPRFYDETLSQALKTGDEFVLGGPEAHHALRVLRLDEGARVVVFDGQGGEILCAVRALNKRELRLNVVERVDANRELDCGFHVITALPKGDRQKVLVDGLVQLGVTELTPLECERAVVVPKDSVLEKLRRNVVEYSKQCGRNVLMQIGRPISINQLAEESGQEQIGKFVAHPYGDAVPLHRVATTGYSEAKVIIGPEGGLGDAEVSALHEAGWAQVTLGARILRVEMAALSLAAWWSQRPPSES